MHYKLEARGLSVGDTEPRRRRERKPSLAGALKQAMKAGLDVKGATVEPDGRCSLQFGKPAPAEPMSDLDRELEEFERRHAH